MATSAQAWNVPPSSVLRPGPNRSLHAGMTKLGGDSVEEKEADLEALRVELALSVAGEALGESVGEAVSEGVLPKERLEVAVAELLGVVDGVFVLLRVAVAVDVLEVVPRGDSDGEVEAVALGDEDGVDVAVVEGELPKDKLAVTDDVVLAVNEGELVMVGVTVPVCVDEEVIRDGIVPEVQSAVSALSGAHHRINQQSVAPPTSGSPMCIVQTAHNGELQHKAAQL